MLEPYSRGLHRSAVSDAAGGTVHVVESRVAFCLMVGISNPVDIVALFALSFIKEC